MKSGCGRQARLLDGFELGGLAAGSAGRGGLYSLRRLVWLARNGVLGYGQTGRRGGRRALDDDGRRRLRLWPLDLRAQ